MTRDEAIDKAAGELQAALNIVEDEVGNEFHRHMQLADKYMTLANTIENVTPV